jgi:hypothetical protein
MLNDLTQAFSLANPNDAPPFVPLPMRELIGSAFQDDDNEGKRPNSAAKLVLFVSERAELFHDCNRESYATLSATSTTFKIGSSGFDDWLCATYMKETGDVAREQAKREAINTLRGMARFSGEELPVFTRCGQADDRYFIDLCQSDNAKAVEVWAGGWQISERPAVRFVRNPDSLRLPEPIKGGSIAALWQVANVPEEARPLVLTWLLDAYRPDTPFPVLELIGEEGTAKSTTQSALRDLLDPNRVNLRAAPKSSADLCVSASVNWCVSYENLSHLNSEMQDALCTVSTGGGFATRKLYTSGEETTISFKRPVMLNGISAVVTQQDLLGRTIALELPRITHRTEAKETADLFELHRASILGGVFDLFAATLAALPTTQISPERRPRMADFCRLGMAMFNSQDKDPERFFELFSTMRTKGIHRTIDASPVASAIIAFIENNPNGVTALPAKILDVLDKYRPDRCDAWPKSGKGMSDALRRLSPALNSIGYRCNQRADIATRTGGVMWSIERSDPH